MLGDLVATGANGGTYARVDVARVATKVLIHSCYGSSYYATSGATPSCMRYTNHLLYRVVQHDGDAISKREGQRDASLSRDEGIAFVYLLGCPGLRIVGVVGPVGAPIIQAVGYENVGTVYIPERDARVGEDAKTVKHELAIAYHVVEVVTSS